MTFKSLSQPQVHRRVMGFVDAGYLTKRLEDAGWENPNEINGRGLMLAVTTLLAATPGLNELIRIYVYDGQHEDPHHKGYKEQKERFDRLASVPGIRLRLGHLVERSPADPKRSRLEQKGVDTLMVLDLVLMAQQDAYDIALICSGDRDLAEAVRVAADDYSRRIWLLATPDRAGVHQELIHAADHVIDLSPQKLAEAASAILRTT